MRSIASFLLPDVAQKEMEEIKMANETMRIFFPLKVVSYPQ
ncbi:hypothetical protein [Geosporobacter ferrireducens]|nr:hypothetical protein [Geosporobacter ferrireducens]